MMMIGIIHSNDTYAIDFEHERIDPKDRVVYTGQGYFSVYYDGSAHNASAWEATYSKDKVNWRNAVTDSNYKFLDRLVNSSNIPTSQVIETNDGYMIREKNHKRHGLNYATRDDNIILLDKNFNVLKSYSGDYVSDMSYINGVYYINTYSQYGEYIPETHMNVVSEEKSYYSTDFENWHVYNESGGIPIINDGHELFIRNGKLQYDRYFTQDMGDIALSQNGVTKQGIIYESVDIGEIIQVHDYLFANLAYDGRELPGKVAVSKDGVYFTIIDLPLENCLLCDVFELKDNRFEFYLKDNSGYIKGFYSCPIEKIDDWNICWTITGGAEWGEEGKNTVSIPESECSDGYNGGTPTPPTNPEFPIEVEDNKNYTYLFEDQWPLYGDYDMNDIVLTIQKRKIYTNKENKVTKFELSIDLSAAGATKSIGAAIMLDNVPANAITQPVEFSDNTLAKNFNLNNNNIENGQDYTVIPLFDDAHKVLGRDRYEQINTVSDYAGNTKPKNISFSITFNNPTISADAFNVNKLNVFIIVDGNRNPRKEIHVAGYQPTKLANIDLFGGNNDNSHHASKKYYISKENLAWGIMVPSNFKWPLEYVNIKTAYSQFSDWVTSGGTENEKWWNDFDVNKVFQTNKN